MRLTKIEIGLALMSLIVVGIAFAIIGHARSNNSQSLPKSSYTITKECRQYISQHLEDKMGEPVNRCTVDFVPPFSGITAGQVAAGSPMPVGMTCNMDQCYLNMEGVLQQYGTTK